MSVGENFFERSGKKVGNWREISLSEGYIAMNYYKLSENKFFAEKVGNGGRVLRSSAPGWSVAATLPRA